MKLVQWRLLALIKKAENMPISASKYWSFNSQAALKERNVIIAFIVM